MIDLNSFKGQWDKVKQSLPEVLASYEEDIDEAESRLSIKGKTGAQALKEQTAWPAYYGMRKAETNKLLKYMNAQVEASRSRLFRRYEQYSKQLSDRTTDKYIDNEPEYLSYLEVYLEVEEVRDKLAAICDAFTSRGFALKEWTSLKIAQLQEDLI
jgi:hypothetical protein